MAVKKSFTLGSHNSETPTTSGIIAMENHHVRRKDSPVTATQTQPPTRIQLRPTQELYAAVPAAATMRSPINPTRITITMARAETGSGWVHASNRALEVNVEMWAARHHHPPNATMVHATESQQKAMAAIRVSGRRGSPVRWLRGYDFSTSGIRGGHVSMELIGGAVKPLVILVKSGSPGAGVGGG